MKNLSGRIKRNGKDGRVQDGRQKTTGNQQCLGDNRMRMKGGGVYGQGGDATND